MCSFNVEGLKSKLEDPDFLDFFQDFHISVLQKHGKLNHLTMVQQWWC